MAVGRGEFFRSLLEGLERKPAQAEALGRFRPCHGGGSPRSGGGQSGPGKGKRNGKRRKKQPSEVNFSGNDYSYPEPIIERKKADFPQLKTSPPEENLLERLPSELLVKILSYLDASSLFCISHVSRLFNQLASNNVVWQKIYLSDFGSQTWRPKLADDAEPKDPAEGHWKKMYLRTIAGQELNKWRRQLRHINPYTGMPRDTEWVLRYLNVSWELTVCDCWGVERVLQQSRVYFCESSVIMCWSGGGSFPLFHQISNIQLHGVRRETTTSHEVRKPEWRSLILKLDLKTCPNRFIGKDRLIKLLHLLPGVVIGIWRGQSSVAFVMISLHFHKLVEKSLLGSPVCPYTEPVDVPPADNSDPEFGLHGYTLHFILHNTGTEIMSGHFRQLSCRTVQAQPGLLELRIISGTNFSQHRSLSGSIKLPWRSDTLEGSVENCCMMTLTLLDEFQKPFWCVSSPVRITMAKRTRTSDYSGEHFLMEHSDPEGQVKMRLVWLKEQKQFFLISLSVYVPVFKVNKHFSTEYRS